MKSHTTFSALVFAIALLASSTACADDLPELVSSGQVRVDAVRGNGNSSGFSLEGQLQNLTNDDKEISVYFGSPLFLVNHGNGQDMLAFAVLELDGGYYQDDSGAFLQLDAGSILPIALIAYCVDFEKDNPAVTDSFGTSAVPTRIARIAEAIRLAEKENIEHGRDATVALQLALWLAQGVSIDDIRERFPFTQQDENIARELLDSIR